MSAARPFSNDPEFLDAAFQMLATRARRLTLERERRLADEDEAVEWPRRGRRRQRADDEDHSLDRLAMLVAREERQAGELEARLQATRSDPNAQQLGLDVLAMANDLGEDERIILVLATCFTLSEDLAEYVCGDLGTGFAGNGSVEFYMRLLECDSTADRVRARRMFRADAPLIRSGLMSLDRMRNDAPEPEDLLWSRLRLSQSALDAIVGAAPDLALVEAKR